MIQQVEFKPTNRLRKDVEQTVGSLHRLNAPTAIGYACNKDGRGAIYSGAYVNTVICDKQWALSSGWDIYYDFETKKFYNLIGS